MSFFREIRLNSILSAILAALFGLLLLLFPSLTATIVCYICGALVILLGLGQIVEYFRSDPLENAHNELPLAVLFIAGGILVILNAGAVIRWAPVVLATVVIFSGLGKLQRMLDCLRLGYRGWWPAALVLGLVCAGFGVLLLVDPFGWRGHSAVLYACLGAGLLYGGLSDLFVIFFVSRRARKFAEKARAAAAESAAPAAAKAEKKPGKQDAGTVPENAADEGKGASEGGESSSRDTGDAGNSQEGTRE